MGSREWRVGVGVGDWRDGDGERGDLRSGYCAGGVGAMDIAGDEGGGRVADGGEGGDGSEGAGESC